MINQLIREAILFNRFGDIAETLLKCYIFYHEAKPEKDYLDEIRLLQETIREERERNKQLEEARDLHKKKAEYYWVILHGEGYCYDDSGTLIKHVQGELQPVEGEEDDE